MQQYGLLRNESSVKLLILFTLKVMNRPTSFATLNNIIMAAENANYFDVATYFEDLVASGHIAWVDEPDERLYYITRLGLEATSVLEQDLPRSDREKISISAGEELIRIRAENEITAKITEKKKGVELRLTLNDGSTPYFDLTVLVGSRDQAVTLATRFKESPEAAYSGIMSLLAGTPDGTGEDS